MVTELKRMQQRRASAAAWTADNPVLLSGEIGVEVVADAPDLWKIGDGTSAWNSLDYQPGAPDEGLPDPLTGTGSPVGQTFDSVDSADMAPGTRYVDTDGLTTTGALEWMKVGDAGDDTWVVTLGDTGWRDITGDLGMSGEGYVLGRRTHVGTEYQFADGDNAISDADSMMLPEGMRPSIPDPVADGPGGMIRTPLVKADGTDAGYAVYKPGGFDMLHLVGFVHIGSSGVQSCDDAWPSPLPGVEVTAPFA